MKRVLKTKYTIAFVASLAVLITLQNCERDDICAETTATTPRLLIEFYDATSRDDLKSVPRLTLYGETLVTDPIIASEATLVFNTNENSAELPLKIEPEEGESITITRFVLEKDTNRRLDGNDATESNIDIIEIMYTSESVYVSRGCGYKSIFNDLNVDLDPIDVDTWISSIEVVETIETTVENENTVHVRIFH